MKHWFMVLAVMVGVGSSVLKARPTMIDPPVVGYPNVMVGLGDSISRGVNPNPTLGLGEHPEYAWSTGTAIQSHFKRIQAANPSVVAHNLAVSGAEMGGLANQAQQIPLTADYVALLMGANDACAADVAGMTSVANYRQQFEAGLTAMSTRVPNARIYISSNIDLYRLWDVLHNDSQAQMVWSSYNVCQSIFANPTSTAPADVTRRQAVLQRVVDYNTQLSEVCAQFIHCRYDGGVVTNTPLSASDASNLDYFHPSVAGQTKLATTTYSTTFDFTDTVPPTTTAQVVRTGDTMTVTLSAVDNVAVAGIEYRGQTGGWTRYTSPVVRLSTEPLIYRAVDVNGVTEASRPVEVPVNDQRFVYIPLIVK